MSRVAAEPPRVGNKAPGQFLVASKTTAARAAKVRKAAAPRDPEIIPPAREREEREAMELRRARDELRREDDKIKHRGLLIALKARIEEAQLLAQVRLDQKGGLRMLQLSFHVESMSRSPPARDASRGAPPLLAHRCVARVPAGQAEGGLLGGPR